MLITKEQLLYLTLIITKIKKIYRYARIVSKGKAWKFTSLFFKKSQILKFQKDLKPRINF